MLNRFVKIVGLERNQVDNLTTLNRHKTYIYARGFKSYLFSKSRTEAWDPVDDGRNAYVVSAYYDERIPSVIRIVGFRTMSHRDQFYCHLWYEGEAEVYMKEVPAVTEYINSNTLRYTECIFVCDLGDGGPPSYVSIVPSSCNATLNLRPVVQQKIVPYKYKFTVCVAPLHAEYENTFALVEWIELNIVLGAERFVFYNHSSVANVAKVLRMYSKRGLAEVIQWPLPVQTGKKSEVHYFAQTAQLADCLERNRQLSEFVVNIDLDEFIIPHGNFTDWSELIYTLPYSSAYLFRNTFFSKCLNDTTPYPRKDEADKYKLVTLRKTLHENYIYQANDRSKYIARTNSTDIMVTHYVSHTRHGGKILVVEPSVGLLHHYRIWPIESQNHSLSEDRTVIEKYKDVLINKVKAIWNSIDDV